jgi:hypothetical protein
MLSTVSKKKLNHFEKVLYKNILTYWRNLCKENIDFNSEKHKLVIEHLGLNDEDYSILKQIYKQQ